MMKVALTVLALLAIISPSYAGEKEKQALHDASKEYFHCIRKQVKHHDDGVVDPKYVLEAVKWSCGLEITNFDYSLKKAEEHALEDETVRGAILSELLQARQVDRQNMRDAAAKKKQKSSWLSW